MSYTENNIIATYGWIRGGCKVIARRVRKV
jgi:hypothetical protein